MHIPDALLDPRVSVATAAIAAGGLGFGLRSIEKELGERTTVLMGIMSAFVFAAQMVNFPLGPLFVSGHLLGGVLSAVMLGPWAGAVVIAAVLIVQCFLFGDGGLTALGANFVNMGLIGAVGGYAIYDPIRRAIGGPRGVLLGAMIAAWFAVLLASGAFAVELAFSRGWSNFFETLSWMSLVHAGIGLGEAIVTGLVVRFILLTRPDLVYRADAGPTEPSQPIWGRLVLSGLGIALAVAAFLAPFASEHPDGLEFVGRKLGFLKEDSAPPLVSAPLVDYKLSLFGTHNVQLATALAGLLGTAVVFAVALGLARVFSRRGPEGVAPDAA